jgi:molecular chaperone DnaK
MPKLELVFEKNAILPLKKTLVRTVSKTIGKGTDDSLIINILEGTRFASPATCVPLGIIEFSGKDLLMNLIKGSDVEITIEISESRDIKVHAVLLMTDQELSNIFNPSTRTVNTNKLKNETLQLLRAARRELQDLEKHEEYKLAEKVNKLIKELEEMNATLLSLSENDVTDIRYQLEERKRKNAQIIETISNERNTENVKSDYFEQKRATEYMLETAKDEQLQRRFDKIIGNEREFLATNNIIMIKYKTKELLNIDWQIRQKDPVTWIGIFHYYAGLNNYKDERKAQDYRKIGESALQRQNYDELRAVVYGLHALLPPEERTDDPMKGTGLE